MIESYPSMDMKNMYLETKVEDHNDDNQANFIDKTSG
jgi:hypothetical protein